MAEQINGVWTIPSGSGYSKILNVRQTGFSTVVMSLTRYSNQSIVVAFLTVYPGSQKDSKVTVKYIQGAKGADQYSVKIFYKEEPDNSISIYVTKPFYDSCGFRVITSQMSTVGVTSSALPEGAVEV